MKFIVTMIILVATALSVHGEPLTFVVDDPGGKNVASFTSRAAIETIVGTTNSVTGTVTFDPSDLTKPVKAHIKVDLTKVSTGISLRDEHMRSENYLNTDLYPTAEFSLDGIVKSEYNAMPIGEPVDVTLNGKFTVHGITKDVTITGRATYLGENPDLANFGYPGHIFNFDATWMINLADYQIKRPQLLFLKLSEEQVINVNFTATSIKR